MAHYLTIPDVTEAEDLISVVRDANEHSFHVTLHTGQTAVWLIHAASTGAIIPLVVVALDTIMLALDDVVVSGAESSGGAEPLSTLTLNAREVRFV